MYSDDGKKLLNTNNNGWVSISKHILFCCSEFNSDTKIQSIFSFISTILKFNWFEFINSCKYIFTNVDDT
jgi:hypothetical protein